MKWIIEIVGSLGFLLLALAPFVLLGAAWAIAIPALIAVAAVSLGIMLPGALALRILRRR